MIERHLRGLLASISDGVGLDWFAQALMLGPLREIRPAAVWVVSVNPGLALKVLGSATLRGQTDQLLIDDAAVQGFFLETIFVHPDSSNFNRSSDDLPVGLRSGASRYSVLQVMERSLHRGFLILSHEEHWDWEQLSEEFFLAVEAITLHAIESVVGSPWKRSGLQSVASSLSKRQTLILQKMSTGLTNYQIGHSMNVSESTVKQECIKIFRFLNVNNRREAVDKALRVGILGGAEEALSNSHDDGAHGLGQIVTTSVSELNR